jgi:hypothetical protein
VLPRVPNDPERIEALPGCGLVIRQPCRPDPLAATAGGAGHGASDAGGADTTGPPNEDVAAQQATGSSLPATGGTTAWPLVTMALVIGLAARRLSRASSTTS